VKYVARTIWRQHVVFVKNQFAIVVPKKVHGEEQGTKHVRNVMTD